MTTSLVIGTVAVLALAAFGTAVALVILPGYRGRRLRESFGPEYERVVAERGSRRPAERELLRRQRRHARLDLRALPPHAREEYVEEWARLRELFVDDPNGAVHAAEMLVTRLMAARGYPTTEGLAQRVADLSVRYPHTVEHYRAAREISDRADTTTEELRTAMVHYRLLISDLVGERIAGDRPAGAAAQPPPPPSNP